MTSRMVELAMSLSWRTPCGVIVSTIPRSSVSMDLHSTGRNSTRPPSHWCLKCLFASSVQVFFRLYKHEGDLNNFLPSMYTGWGTPWDVTVYLWYLPQKVSNGCREADCGAGRTCTRVKCQSEQITKHSKYTDTHVQ
jgi:hypothetical protein